MRIVEYDIAVKIDQLRDPQQPGWILKHYWKPCNATWSKTQYCGIFIKLRQAIQNNILHRHTHRCEKYIKNKIKGRISPKVRTVITSWEEAEWWKFWSIEAGVLALGSGGTFIELIIQFLFYNLHIHFSLH